MELLTRTAEFDDEMLEIALFAVKKLDGMSDEEFSRMEFCPEFGDEDSNSNRETEGQA
jgi:hypothetical protein